MPLFGQRKRDYQRNYMRQRRAHGKGLTSWSNIHPSTITLSQTEARSLRSLGIDPASTKDPLAAQIADLKRRLDAKDAHLQWEHDARAKLERRIASLESRITQLQADHTLHEATAHYSLDPLPTHT